MKLNIKAGKTSKRLAIFIQDAAASDGSGLTGLTNLSGSLTAYYWREDAGNAGGTAISIVSATRGSFTSGGFIEIDATNLPGWYEIGIPNTAIATGGNWVIVCYKGAAGMVPVQIEIQLTADNPDTLVVLATNTALANFQFFMANSAGVGQTGKTVTAQRVLDNGSLASCANSVVEISAGIYRISLAATDLNATTVGMLFTATGCVDLFISVIPQQG